MELQLFQADVTNVIQHMMSHIHDVTENCTTPNYVMPEEVNGDEEWLDGNALFDSDKEIEDIKNDDNKFSA